MFQVLVVLLNVVMHQIHMIPMIYVINLKLDVLQMVTDVFLVSHVIIINHKKVVKLIHNVL